MARPALLRSAPTRRGRDESKRSVASRLTATATRWPSRHHWAQSAIASSKTQVGQGVDQAALLRQGQEVLGGYQPERWMGPSQERLDGDHLTGPQVDLRLIVQCE